MLRFPSPQPGAPRVLAATPAGHHHEFGALAGALLAAGRGLEAIYLGADIPEEDLMIAVERSGADLLVLSVVLAGPTDAATERLARSIERLNQKVSTWVGTGPAHPLRDHLKEVNVFHRFEDLDLAFTQLMTRIARTRS
jgi:methanogenic corrinoid protein MtbC1